MRKAELIRNKDVKFNKTSSIYPIEYIQNNIDASLNRLKTRLEIEIQSMASIEGLQKHQLEDPNTMSEGLWKLIQFKRQVLEN